MAKYIQKGDKHTKATKRRLSETLKLHRGYSELRKWQEGKRPDRRTAFGQFIYKVEENIISDLGGQEALSQMQRLLIDRILEKLVYLERIGSWSMEQETLIDSKGQLLPALGKNYVAYSNAFRRDLESLYSTVNHNRPTGYQRTLKRITGGR